MEALMSVARHFTLWLVLGCLAVLPGCSPKYKPGLPPGSPFAEEVVPIDQVVTHGVASGDVSSRSAVIWFRTAGPARTQVEWFSDGDATARSPVVQTAPDDDFTVKVRLDGLAPGVRYRYRILTAPLNGADPPQFTYQSMTGQFTTAFEEDRSETVKFVWGADLGGQQRCRRPPNGYGIFDYMRQQLPSFALLIGDLIYSDDRCPAPPNAPGSDFLASTLKEYRAKHRYQREDPSLQQFLADVPVYAIWDDHEVRNNFSGPYEPLTATGRQALLDYWPIGPPPEEPSRLYRRFRRGADVELFILDTRQYRSSNSEQDNSAKTMLGADQRKWLLDGLGGSTATWKVIVTSVPLSSPKGGTLLIPGNDSWAHGADGTGFQSELSAIVQAILRQHIQNVVWLAADVHYAQVNAYDPDDDGVADFHEFICGPLSAGLGQPVPPQPTFRPTTLYSTGGFMNFGMVAVEKDRLRVAIIDDGGTVRFEHTVQARSR